MIVSPWLFKRALIPWWLVLALGASACRWVVLASVTDVGTILFSQPLHGLSFGLRWVCYLTLVRTFASHNTMATAQGLFLGSFSAGGVFGMLVWGAAYDEYGGAGVFSAAAVVALLSTVVTLPLLRSRLASSRAAVA